MRRSSGIIVVYTTEPSNSVDALFRMCIAWVIAYKLFTGTYNLLYYYIVILTLFHGEVPYPYTYVPFGDL